MKIIARLFLLSLLLVPCMAKAAEDEYIQPTAVTLLQTLLRFGSLDINNDVIIDDYAKVIECDLFSVFHDDDFKWNKIRDGLRSKIKNEAVTYPTNYMVKGYIKLDRYDFDTKTFKIDAKSPILGINAFRLLDIDREECHASIKAIPTAYVAVIESRVNIPGFIMSESDAQALLSRMTKDGNYSRQILAKFNLRIIEAPKTKVNYAAISLWYDKSTYVGKSPIVNMSAKLDAIEFFEDDDMKRRIFVYKP